MYNTQSAFEVLVVAFEATLLAASQSRSDVRVDAEGGAGGPAWSAWLDAS
jgi:hypothetical protein